MKTSARLILAYALCYLLWVVSAALGLLDLVLGRGLLISAASLVAANRWVLSTIDRLGIVLLGVAWLAFVVASESYYRNGIDEGDLFRRFGLVTASELSVPVLAYVVSLLIP